MVDIKPPGSSLNFKTLGQLTLYHRGVQIQMTRAPATTIIGDALFSLIAVHRSRITALNPYFSATIFKYLSGRASFPITASCTWFRLWKTIPASQLPSSPPSGSTNPRGHSNCGTNQDHKHVTNGNKERTPTLTEPPSPRRPKEPSRRILPPPGCSG